MNDTRKTPERLAESASRPAADRGRSSPSTSTSSRSGTGSPARPPGRAGRSLRAPDATRRRDEPGARMTGTVDRSGRTGGAPAAEATARAGSRSSSSASGLLMIILDQTIVNVALPSIQDDLGFSQSNLAWVVNAYLIAFGGLLLLAGRLGDLIGRRRIFMTGLAVFTIASLVCGLAQSQEMLIGARFVQGVGGAMTSAVILGMIVTMFPEPA